MSIIFKPKHDRFKIRGLSAEVRAAYILKREKYKILERNFVAPFGEIDIIAKDENCIVVVEVKQRQTLKKMRLCVSSGQRGRIRKTWKYFMDRNPYCCIFKMRYDIILFAAQTSQYIHIQNAFG